MVECMAASSRWLKVREGWRERRMGRGRRRTSEVKANRTDGELQGWRVCEQKQDGERDVRERVKALMGDHLGLMIIEHMA